MTAPLYSPQWYRVARVRPQLGSQVRVQRQHWRDQRWYLLIDDASGRSHRINEAAYQFVGRCDGLRNVHEIWSALLEAQPDLAPTQDEVLALLGQLGELELLQAEGLADTEGQVQDKARRRRERRRARLNPFFFQLPLGNPSGWLPRLDGLARGLFSVWGAVLWLLLVGTATLVAAVEWPVLRAHANTGLTSPGNLLLMWVSYPVMKALHELAHALAVRRYGGDVNEVGVGLMYLVPAPYVDASAANAFTSRFSRAVVGAAGILAELAVAAVGLWLHFSTQAGWLHELGFVLAVIGVASTLLFNGNPLLRFDAYFVLCDLMDLPNLAARSAQWWQSLLGRRLLGSRTEPPLHARSERKWLVLYAPASLAWRLILSVSIVLWLGAHWMLLGLAVAAYAVFGVILKPVAQWARLSLDSSTPGREQARVRLRLGVTALVAVVALFVVPLPFNTVAPAVVWLPEHAQVRAEVEGFVSELPLADGQHVRKGDLLLRLRNPELVAARDQLASRLEGLRAEQFQVLLRDPNAAQNLQSDLRRLQAEVGRAEERLAQLEVRAQTDGTLVMPRQQDWMGAFVRQGHAIGHVLAPGEVRVRAAVAQADAHLIRQQQDGRLDSPARVRLADLPYSNIAATLSAQVPAATRQLPSAALADVGGGPYPVDPEDKEGTRTRDPIYLFDLRLEDAVPLRVGARAWVRFDHGYEALAIQGYRRAAQLFLQHFAPTG